MSPLARLKNRLTGRPDSEHEQATLRIVIVGAIWGYMALFGGAKPGEEHLYEILVAGLGGFFAVAVTIFACIVAWPAPNVVRRSVGMLADTIGPTFYMFLGEAYGATMLAVFLFVTFGNGFRFGRKYLFACQGLSLLGLVSVLAFVPFWQEQRPIGVGLLISLVVLPLYVSTLLKRIHEARQRAEEANTAKTAFLANMSHEMRTPLNGIMGTADLLSTTALTNHQAEIVGLLRHSVKVLRSLVDDVLDITKIESGRLTIETVTFDLYQSVAELTNILQPHAAEKNLYLKVLIDPRIDYLLRGDPHHLRQVLLNLIGNALKFTNVGGVTVRLRKVGESAAGVQVRVEVSDTGIGIPPQALGRIFERFVQADQSTTRRFGGTGLGTTIAKQLVEHMGGVIGVDSTVGVGSTFWFELPLLHSEACAGEALHPKEGVNGTVLILEETNKACLLRDTLACSGFKYALVRDLQSLSWEIEHLNLSGERVLALVSSAPLEPTIEAANKVSSSRERPIPVVYVVPADEHVSTIKLPSTYPALVISESDGPKALKNAIHYFAVGVAKQAEHEDALIEVLQGTKIIGKILVAEDNLTNQTIIKELLTRAGHTVVLASDGDEALDAWEAHAPDLAILDFNMPNRTGCEAIKAIRLMEGERVRMPAIILSASVTPESKDRAVKSGADAFVGKPFDASQLLQTIETLLSYNDHLGAEPELAPESAASAKQTEIPNPSTTPASGLVNWARVRQLEEIARTPYFIAELLRGFKDDSERLLIEIRLAQNAGHVVALADAAHALKGAAVGVGATKLSDGCSRLELLLKQPVHLDDREVVTMVGEIEQTYSASLEELNHYAQNKHDVSLIP